MEKLKDYISRTANNVKTIKLYERWAGDNFIATTTAKNILNYLKDDYLNKYIIVKDYKKYTKIIIIHNY